MERNHRHPRRAALLTGASLGAVAALGLGDARAQQGPFLYVPGGVGDVSVVDTSKNTVIGGPIPVAGTPIAAAVRGDGAFAYIVNGLANTVVPIDTATNTAGAPIPVGTNPSGAVFAPDGKTVNKSVQQHRHPHQRCHQHGGRSHPGWGPAARHRCHPGWEDPLCGQSEHQHRYPHQHCHQYGGHSYPGWARPDSRCCHSRRQDRLCELS